MTVANNYAPIRQLGNGVTTAFSGSWSMINAANAVVALESVTTGVRTSVTQGSGANQYTISITSSGFTVTFNTAPSSSYYVDISRATVLSQTNSYSTSYGFQGQVEENSFDALTAMVQDAAYNASQSISIPTGESLTTLLPSAGVRANGYLAFDSSGNVIVSPGNGSAIPISSVMTPVVQATTLALARTAMAVAGLADNNAFTGSNSFSIAPTGPTPAAGDNSTKSATTAYVDRGASGASDVLLATATASNSASIQFTSIPSGYDQYELRVTGLLGATSGANCLAVLSENNGSTYLSSYSNDIVTGGNGSVSNSGGAGQSQMTLCSIGSGTAYQQNFLTRFFGLGSSTFYKQSSTQYEAIDNTSTFYTGLTANAYLGDTGAVNAIKILMSSGNISSGKFALYGIRNT